MMDTLAKIKQTLEKMVDVHQRLLQLAKEKREILVDGTVSSLQNVISQESTCVEKVQNLEEDRKQLVHQYFSEKGISSNTFTVQDLVETLENEEEKSSLLTCAGQLIDLIREISHLNESNQELIKMSLSYIQYSMGMFIKKEPSIGYGPRSSKGHLGYLDAKV
jgi:flagellar biosynthesis/type III secretory pathway chaperone